MRLLFVTLLFCLTACSDETPLRLNNGDAAPAFSTTMSDGQPYALAAGGNGRPLLIAFWADWCRYCAAELRAIDTLHRRRPDAFAVVAINTGQDRSTVTAFVRKLGIGFPALLDEESTITRRYGVIGLPATYLVDAQGIIRGKLLGEADAATIERQLAALVP